MLMQLHSAQLRIHDEMPASAPAAAACRRRLRWMESAYPRVLAWSVSLAPAPGAAEVAPIAQFEAQVAAIVDGDEAVEATACSPDGLAALRLAFNRLEERLQDADRDPTWLQRLWGRIGSTNSQGLSASLAH